MLKTNLKHLESNDEIKKILEENERVMVCCGRMEPMCIFAYDIMESLKKQYPNILFMDMDFDIRAANFIKNLPECASFMGLPFTVYFKKGKVVKATAGIQNKEQIVEILNNLSA